ncbi:MULTISPECIES: cytochrome c oxidase assembly protein [unclassified Microbacteriaceae]|uniref:Cytochrome c oxidase assembly protein n=1 Tax=Herbiconiux sp. A18JL235 TaxID=3152363 RepID=A0AB39BN28_9MICO
MTGDPTGPVWVPAAPPDLTQFLAPNLQPIPLIPAIALVLLVAYSIGAARLWLTGRRWSVTRTVCFVAGCLILIITMGAGLEGYGYRMFSVFMFQQLTLMMAVPPLLVLGSPGTLLLKAVPHRGLGILVQRAALTGLRSRAAKLLLHPAVMIPLFLFTFYGLYLSGIANALLGSWTGHIGLELLFLASGILFTIPLISADPLPARQSHLGRLLDVFAEMPLHAFFGVIIMLASVPLIAYFASPPASWGIDPLQDQLVAGALAWSYGELPTLIIVLVLLSRWHRDDTRRARAADRRHDKHGDADLDAYNDYLHRLNTRDTKEAP